MDARQEGLELTQAIDEPDRHHRGIRAVRWLPAAQSTEQDALEGGDEEMVARGEVPVDGVLSHAQLAGDACDGQRVEAPGKELALGCADDLSELLGAVDVDAGAGHLDSISRDS